MSRGTEPQTTPVAPNPKSTPKETDAEATSTVARGEEVATDGAADDSLVPQYQERLFRIYQEHEPVMRAYKRAISICVHEDEHDFTLQRIPGNPKDIQYKTTCGHMYCKSANGVFEPHTYRVSIERKQNADPQKPLDGAIPLEPLHKWSSTLAKCEQVPSMLLLVIVLSISKALLLQGQGALRSAEKERTSSIGYALSV